MRAITLTQPYAALVAYGEKGVETRSWRTPYRGLLAIHAGVGLEPVGGMSGLVALMESEPFAAALRPHVSGYTPEERARDLVRGAIVAVVELVEIRRLDRPGLPDDLRHPARLQEEAFGDYRAGRYAWTLQNRLNLYDGVECRGALGVWKVPKDALAEIFDSDDELRKDLGVR
jgi:hypothetical protein